MGTNLSFQLQLNCFKERFWYFSVNPLEFSHRKSNFFWQYEEICKRFFWTDDYFLLQFSPGKGLGPGWQQTDCEFSIRENLFVISQTNWPFAKIPHIGVLKENILSLKWEDGLIFLRNLTDVDVIELFRDVPKPIKIHKWEQMENLSISYQWYFLF